MRCRRCRDALSARLDAEDDPVERSSTDRHLAECPDCRRWFEDAAAVTRLARIGVVRAAPGVPDSVLDAAPTRSRRRLPAVLRLALGLVGALQVLLGVAQAAAIAGVSVRTVGMFEGAEPAHLIHESAAWNAAVGTGFLFVAWRRTRPAAIVPILSVFVVALLLVSVDDLIDGWVRPQRLLGHLLLLAGYVIVLTLSGSRMGSDTPPGPVRVARTGPRRTAPAGRWPARVAGRDRVIEAADHHRVA